MSNEKKTLAVKSNKYILLYSILLAITSLLTIFSFVKFFEDKETPELLILGIVFLLLDTVILFVVLKTAINPKVMIEYDNFGIYLNYFKKTVYLKYKDIYRAFAENERARGIEYNFGHLAIWVGDERYKIGAIKDVKSAENFINKKIAWKYSTKKSYRKK